MIYLIVLLLLILLTLNYDIRGVKTGRDFWYNFLLISFIAIAGLRFRVGGDTLHYIDEFSDIPFLSGLLKYNFKASRWDPLWVVFSSICRTIDDDFIFLQCVHALIVNFIIFRFIKKNTSFRFTAILIYYIFAYLYFNTEILRESLAIAVFLLSLRFFIEGKFIKYYLIVVVSFLIHSSALILFLLPIVPRLKFNKWTIGLIIISFVALLVIRNDINNVFTFLYLNERIESKATVYSEYNLNIFGSIFDAVRFCILPLYLIYLHEKFFKVKYKYTFLILIMVGIGVVVIFVPIFARFNNYMTIFYVIFLAEFLNRLYRYRKLVPLNAVITNLAFLILCVLQLYSQFEDTSRYAVNTHHYNHWYPYHSVFDKEVDQKRERLVGAEH